VTFAADGTVMVAAQAEEFSAGQGAWIATCPTEATANLAVFVTTPDYGDVLVTFHPTQGPTVQKGHRQGTDDRVIQRMPPIRDVCSALGSPTEPRKSAPRKVRNQTGIHHVRDEFHADDNEERAKEDQQPWESLRPPVMREAPDTH